MENNIFFPYTNTIMYHFVLVIGLLYQLLVVLCIRNSNITDPTE